MSKLQILKKYSKTSDNLINMLHDIQDSNEFNYLSKDDLELVADYLDLPYSYVHGVTTFYTMFSLKPRGKNIIRVCQSPPCQLMGASDVSSELKKILEIDFGQTTSDSLFTLEMTSCIGVCGVAPAIMINEEVYGNLTTERLLNIIEDMRRA